MSNRTFPTLICLLVMITIFLTQTSSAQVTTGDMSNLSVAPPDTTTTVSPDDEKMAEDAFSISVGFSVAPYGSYSLKENGRDAFDAGILVLARTSITLNKSGTTFVPVVVLNSMSTGLIVVQSVIDELSVYALCNKRIFEPGGYTAVGVATPVTSGVTPSVLFLEYGSSWGINEYTPTIYVGVLFPFGLKIK